MKNIIIWNDSLGRPGVDITLRHVTEFAVLQIIFIINEVSAMEIFS